MKIRDMTDAETAEHLGRWCSETNHDRFAWPTDACGYEQHLRFVEHRNKNWLGGSEDDFRKFVIDYANALSVSAREKQP